MRNVFADAFLHLGRLPSPASFRQDTARGPKQHIKNTHTRSQSASADSAPRLLQIDSFLNIFEISFVFYASFRVSDSMFEMVSEQI